MAQQPHDLDDANRVVRPFQLPEHMRRELPPIPEAQYRQQPPQQRSYLNDLEYAIRHDPLKQIAATVCSLRFEDMLILAKEICSLEPQADNAKAEEAQILEFKFALKIHTWAKSKFPPPPADQQ